MKKEVNNGFLSPGIEFGNIDSVNGTIDFINARLFGV